MASPLSFGNLSAFDPQTESFTAYMENVQIFFEANEVKEAKRRSVFLSVVGGNVYNLLRNLLAPVAPMSTGRGSINIEGSL